ncbi:MAG: TPM domain-containing protein [bacterium]|nr:TPM domain-containing protein [bacterium]
MMKKRITAVILMVLITIMMTVPALAYEERVDDGAGLLSDEEITQINEKIDYIRNTYSCDVVVVTTNDSEGKSAMDYADDYYDYNGFGMGDEHDGIILTVNMDIREYWMSTCGQAILLFSDSEIEDMKSTVQTYLSDGDYGNGFLAWLSDVEYYLETDDGSGYIIEDRNPFAAALTSLPMGLMLGLVLAVIIIIIMIRKCRTAVQPTLANDYLDQEHITLRRKEDLFLRSHTSSVKIQTESSSGGSSGGGSSVHRSSSGRSHGGGGGKF